ncbi:MAG: ABC transporter permease [Lachnospiraceae bacterium]
MSVTLSKLSLRNARRQARDYLVYFITIVITAALIYAFNSLVFSDQIRNLSFYLDNLPILVGLASAVVVCIIGWLVSYTTRFMLSKRSRELGTYILLGIENKQVARLFFMENLTIGGIAIVLGTILGNLIFQALCAITLNQFHVTYTFNFAFSIRAVLLTLVYFTVIYLFALLKSRKRISRMKIYDLLYLDRQNENKAVERDRHRRIIFTVSIILGVIGTALLLMRVLFLGIIGAVLIIIFLYGFFISFSSGVPDFFDKRPRSKYKGNNLLVFRSLSSKLSTMGVVMATIALLFTATLIAEGSGFIFNTLAQSRAEQTTSFDLFISSASDNEQRFEGYINYAKEIAPVKQDYRYDIYFNTRQVMDYIEAEIECYELDTLMAYSDYIALREMLGYSPVDLAADEYIIHCMPYLENKMASYTEQIVIDGHSLTPSDQLYTETFTQSTWNGNGHGFILVVPDEVLTTQPVACSMYAAMTISQLSEAVYEELSSIWVKDYTDTDDYYTVFSKSQAERENASMSAMTVYPLYYLALVLTMVAATILTIQLLSETERYKRQYTLLGNLGMDHREMERSLSRQFALFYTMPALPPLLISVPFILGLGGQLDEGVLTGVGHLWSIVGVTLALFFGIYLVYILAAYSSFKKNILTD